MMEAKRSLCKAGVYYPGRLRSGAMSYLDDLFRVIVFGFVVVYWSRVFYGVRDNLERRNKLTRALQRRDGASVDSFARPILDEAMGLSERVMWRWCGWGCILGARRCYYLEIEAAATNSFGREL